MAISSPAATSSSSKLLYSYVSPAISTSTKPKSLALSSSFLPSITTLSVVATPSTQQRLRRAFTVRAARSKFERKNMITGAAQMDGAILVVSGTEQATAVSIQDVTPPQKPPLPRFGNQVQRNPLGKSRVSRQDPLTPRGHIEVESKDTSPNKQRHCNCKNSKCLKLYCECFASGSYCNGCNCLNCHNNLEKETSRQEAIMVILERNPDAFKPKIAANLHGMKDLQV